MLAIFYNGAVFNDLEMLIGFCNDLMVNQVVVWAWMVPGYAEDGYLKAENIEPIKKKLEEADINLAAITSDFTSPSPGVFLGTPEGEEEFNNILRTVDAIGEASIDTFVLYVGASQWNARPEGYSYTGYTGKYFSLPGLSRDKRGRMIFDASDPENRFNLEKEGKVGQQWKELSDKEQWRLFVNFYKRLIPQAEKSNVRIATHSCWLPIYRGLRRVIWNSRLMKRMIDAVPSKYNGVCFCVGCRWSCGDNLYQSIKFLGNKIFNVQLSDVLGIGGRRGNFMWAREGQGNIDHWKVFKALREINYQGVMTQEHFPPLIPLEEGRKDLPIPHGGQGALAYSIGYYKALLSAIERTG